MKKSPKTSPIPLPARPRPVRFFSLSISAALKARIEQAFPGHRGSGGRLSEVNAVAWRIMLLALDHSLGSEHVALEICHTFPGQGGEIAARLRRLAMAIDEWQREGEER